MQAQQDQEMQLTRPLCTAESVFSYVLETQARLRRAHHQAGQFWLANYDSFPDGLAV